MNVFILAAINAPGQHISSGVNLSLDGGFYSNNYLLPYVADWDRSENTTFSSFTPSAYIQLTGSGRTLTVNGTGQLLYYAGDRPDRAAGLLSSQFQQRVTSSVWLRAAGGLHFYSTSDYVHSQSRDMQWFQFAAEWFATPFTKFELTGGSAYRNYVLPDFENLYSSRHHSYGIGTEYWPGFRWRLRADFRSSLSHITTPGDGFSTALSLSHYTRSGTVLMLQTGLEQYTSEFQAFPDSDPAFSTSAFAYDQGAVLPLMDTRQIAAETDTDPDENITLTDRFHRSTFQVSYPVSNRITITGTLSGLLWFTDEDDAIEADYNVSAGIQIPFSIRLSRSGELRNLNWASREPGEAVLNVHYRGDQSLYISGDFNDWDRPGTPLRQTGRHRYSIELELSEGVYEYKISKRNREQLEWIELPEEVPTVSDGFGGENGRVIIDYEL